MCLQPAAQYMTIKQSWIAASYEMFGYISQRSIDKNALCKPQLEVSLVCMIIICIHSMCTINALLTTGYYDSKYSINSVHFLCGIYIYMWLPYIHSFSYCSVQYLETFDL